VPPVSPITSEPISEEWLAPALRERWLNAEPCPAPCWEGVTPGVTGVEEAAEIWKANPLFSRVGKGSSFGAHYVEPYLNLADDPTFRGPIAEARSEPGSLTIDSIRLLYHFAGIPLAQLIAHYGEPTHVIATTAFDFDEPDSEPDFWYVAIIWETHGLGMKTEGDSQVRNIDEELILNETYYFPPRLEMYGTAVGNPARVDIAQPWQGYAAFSRYERPWPP
jgi:hypothetical protein